MARKTRTERLTLSMEEKLKRRFNTLCTWKGINMSDIAHELIEKWVEENTPPGLFEQDDESVGSEQS
ncbi:MAG: plasmid partition protein ParG [Nostocales cyanobacterium 94392]|nr:plasmid partition protein ParG [Nostocales cyanobacterium 94392]